MPKSTIREEFYKETNYYALGDDNVDKTLRSVAEGAADWWLSKFKTMIEGMKIGDHGIEDPIVQDRVIGFNNAIRDILKLLD